MKNAVLGALVVLSLALGLAHVGGYFCIQHYADELQATEARYDALLDQVHTASAECCEGCCPCPEGGCCPCPNESTVADQVVQSGLDYGFLVYELNPQTGQVELFWVVQGPFGQQLLPAKPTADPLVPMVDPDPPAEDYHDGSYEEWEHEPESCGNTDCECGPECPCPHPCPCERK